MHSSRPVRVFRRRRLRALGLLAATAVAASAAVAAVGTGAAQAGSNEDCTPVKLMVVPGTWETSSTADPSAPAGMLQPVMDRLERQYPGKVSSYVVTYSATAFDKGMTYNDSKATGMKGARAALDRLAGKCPGTRFAIVGYSQGADIAGTLAYDIGRGAGPIRPDQYLAGGLVADPGQGTKGAVDLGATQPGTLGIAGPRAGGYRAVSGRVATVCVRGDMYCALPQKDKYLVVIGKVLSQIGVDHALQSVEGREAVTTDLKAGNGKDVDLSYLPAGLQKLVKQTKRGTLTNGQLTALAKEIDNLVPLVRQMQDLERFVGNPLIVNALLNTPRGSQTYIAGQVLQAMNDTDFVGLAKDLSTGLKAADKKDLDSLISLGLRVAKKVAPLAGVPADQLARATTVVEGLRPVAVLAQASNVIHGVLGVDYRGIANAIAMVPTLVASGDVKGLYKVLTTVEDKLMPLAKTANRVDFAPVAALLRMFPQGSNERTVGDALSLLDRVDWVRTTKDLRKLQDGLAKFNPSHPPKVDPNAPRKSLTDIFGVNVLAMVPTISDLASHGLSVAGIDLPRGTINQLLTTDLTPKQVISEGIQAAVFYGSKAHTSYGSATVDHTGRPALTVLSDWLAARVGETV